MPTEGLSIHHGLKDLLHHRLRQRRVAAITPRQQHMLVGGIALFAALISLSVYGLHPRLFDRLDIYSQDLVFQLRKAPAPAAGVAIVAVDEASVKRYGRWPWPRALQADLIRRIKAAGAAVLALDVIYASPQSEAQDALLREALAQEGAAVIGGYFFRGEQSVGLSEAARAAIVDHRIKTLIQHPDLRTDTLAEFPHIEGSIAPIGERFSGHGFINILPDGDGLTRNLPLVLRHGGEFYPALALEALSKASGETIVLELDAEGVRSVRIGEHRIPVDALGRLALNYYNGQERLALIPAARLLDGELAAGSLAGQVVFLGVTELGMADVRPTPIDYSFPGVAIHATAASNILQGFYLYRDNRTLLINILQMALLPLAVVWLMSLLKRPVLMTLLFLACTGLVWGLYFLFVSYLGLLTSLFYPLLAMAISYAAYVIYALLVYDWRARYIRRAFSSYVSPDLVTRLVNESEELNLGGELRTVSVLFSDIRGFTTLSESMMPRQLVELLNLFLGPMTDIIMKEKGTLDKYIGDAVMAIYNAPLNVEGHAMHAAATAIAMQRRLLELNPMFQKRFKRTLKIGVGINTGEAVVGNMGSARRFNYTAMGDAVNLASRLEGRTKYYGTDIIVSESTAHALGESYLLRRLDRLRVKGKHQPVAIFQLFLDDTPDNRDLKRRFEQALEHYFAREFEQALAVLEQLRSDFPRDRVTRLYIERCRYHVSNPPREDWDGVSVAAEK